MIKLMFGDCIEMMKLIEPGSVDLIATDLPYGTTKNKWDSVIPLHEMWSNVKKILKPKGAFVTTASQPFTSVLIVSNMKWFRHCWVWDKKNVGNPRNAKVGPLKTHEDIVVFGKQGVKYFPQKVETGKTRKWKQYGQSESFGSINKDGSGVTEGLYPKSIISFSNANRKGKLHPTEKQLDLYEYIVMTYSSEGDTVLDICMGSGTTGEACINTGRSFIGIENHKPYFDIAEKRIFGTIVPTSEQGSSDETGYVGPKKLYTADGGSIDPAICQV